MELTIGQELIVNLRLKTGETIERIVIKSLLGEGGFARVWKVRNAATGAYFALKTIDVPTLIRNGKLTDAKKAEFSNRIRQEAEVTINSPYVLTCLGFRELEQDAGFWLLFELFGEHDSKEWIGENALVRWDAKKALFLKILEGVNAIHQAGYVHRDLKPQNILIDAQNTPKIADFGLVKAQASLHTQEWSFAGTYPYQDPALIQAGGIKHADARSDVYALGVILYELIMGQDPWTANELYHQAFVQGEIFNLIAGKRHILEVDRKFQFQEDAAVAEIIAQCTAFDREQRTLTLDEMIRRLGGRPGSARVSPPAAVEDQSWLATLPEDFFEQSATQPSQPVKPPRQSPPQSRQAAPQQAKIAPPAAPSRRSSKLAAFLFISALVVAAIVVGPKWWQPQPPPENTPTPQMTVTPRIAATVTPIPTIPEPNPTQDPGSPTTFALDLASNQATYRVGELVVLTVRAERACYLSLYDVSTAGEITQLFPNGYGKDNFLEAGQTFRIPSAYDRFDFGVNGPAGVERIRGICTVRNLAIVEPQYLDATGDFPTIRLSPPQFDRFVREKFAQMPGEEWTAADVSFQVVE